MSTQPKVALHIRNVEPVEEMVRAMSESGFCYVSMGFNDIAPLLSDDWERYVSELRELFARNGLQCVQTHAPYYDLLISAERRDPDTETALMRSVEATKMLGAALCSVHPRSVLLGGQPCETAVDRQRSLQENIDAFRPLADLCQKRGVLLGIENLMRYPNAHPYFYSWLAEDQCELIDRLDNGAVAAVWDFGHANLIDADHAERIRTLGKRIKGTHVHNNGGKEDDHFPPFLPSPDTYYARRCVDWESVLSALKATGYDGFLTLEVVFNFDRPIRPYIRYLYDSVCELERIMNGTGEKIRRDL